MKISTFVKRTSLILAIAIAMVAMMPVGAMAQSVTSAQQGTVVAVRWSTATPSQSYGYGYGYRQPTNTHAIIGGAVGGLIGAVLARHSYSGRYLASAGGAAIGYAVGNAADARYNERQMAPPVGAQVILTLDPGNRTVAVFVPGREAGRFFAGQHVWLIGQDQLVPGN